MPQRRGGAAAQGGAHSSDTSGQGARGQPAAHWADASCDSHNQSSVHGGQGTHGRGHPRQGSFTCYTTSSTHSPVPSSLPMKMQMPRKERSTPNSSRHDYLSDYASDFDYFFLSSERNDLQLCSGTLLWFFCKPCLLHS